jgi:ubiquinone/menaquinone biosynthesis C-methylase UbiE
MIPRILEPEVMDSAEDARDYDSMDHAEVNRAFVLDFLAAWDGANPILDVGTGTAQIPIELCLRHSGTEIVAIDLAEEMLAVANENVRRAGFSLRIRSERQNARAMSYADESFGTVISNSIVHHIPEPVFVFGEMVRVCRKGGTLFVRDLLRPPDEETLTQLVETYAGGANEHQCRLFADSLHAALTVEEVQALIAARGFDPGAVRATSDRHWTWIAKNPS